jgi:hypothetical protein
MKETVMPIEEEEPFESCTEYTMNVEAAERHALEDYRNGGLVPNCDPEIAIAISEALKSQIMRKDVEAGMNDIRWAVTLFNRNRLIDKRVKSDRDSMKLRRLSVLVEQAKQLGEEQDYHFTEVLKHLGKNRNITLGKAQKKAHDFLSVVSDACIKVDRRNSKGKKLADTATDIAVAHLIRSWEVTLHRGRLRKQTLGYTSPFANNAGIRPSFTFNFERGERPKKTDGFVYPSMKFLQLAFAIIDDSVSISRIRTAAEKVSAARTVKKQSVENPEKN